MLEALFQRLNLPDEAFFNKNNFTDNVVQALVESEQNYGIYITGPKTLDLAVHSLLPLYSAWKENNFDNNNFQLLKQGVIITSSNETGEVCITQLATDSKKKETVMSTRILPERNTAQIIYNYDEIWRDLKKGIHFPEYNGNFTAFVLCGNFISNLYEFTVKNAQQEAHDSPYGKKIKQMKKRLSDKQRVLGSKLDQSPEPPDNPSIRLNVNILNKLEPGRSFIISGSFSLSITDLNQYNQVPIHIVLSGKTYKTADIFEILVPLELCTIKDGMIQGYFGFDIMERFYMSDKNTYNIPDSFCISVVHKNMIIAPTEILLK
ncbi:MAG: hypothetical protein PVI26_06815 [Chitinispirillia bacterium]|jgi:hypothetical protein